MNKLILLIFGVLLMFSFVFAGNIDVNFISNLNTQCNLNESEDIDYYIVGSNISRNPYDIFGNTLDSLISHTSEVDIWRNTSVLTNCNDWNRVSNVTVANDPSGALAVHNTDGCIFNIPSTSKFNDIDRIDAQIHYDIAYAKVFPGASNIINGKFYHRDLSENNRTCYPGGAVVSDYSSCSNVSVSYGIMNHHVGECLNYRIFWCGDGLVNGRDGDNIYTNGIFASEQCDPADPTHQGRGNIGCSSSCIALNQDVPTCTLEASMMPNSSYTVDWDIDGVFLVPSQINITPNTVNQSVYNVNTNIGTWTNIVPTGYGTYTASMIVTNAGGSSTCSDTFYVDSMVCGDGNINTPNSAGIYEQCDDGNNINGDGCETNCQLTVPSCNLNVNPISEILGNSVYFSASTNSWADYISFDLDDGTILYNNNINFVYNYAYTYNNIGSYSPLLTVENNYNPIASNVVRPTNICGTSVSILELEGELTINKVLLTTGYFHVGDMVEYTIEVENIGLGSVYDVNIDDIMPVSLDLVSYNIVGVYPYSSNSWQNTNGDWFFEYSGFDLLPGQTVMINVVGQVELGASENQTTNCAFVSGMYDCVIYNLASDPDVLKMQMKSNGTMSTVFTTGAMNVNFGDYVTYKVDFANNGGADTVGGVLVRDHMPVCVDYISASIYGVSNANFSQVQDTDGRWVLDYNGFDLLPGQTGYMLVTGQIMNGGTCNNINVYKNDAYVYFYNPFVEKISSVIANRSELSIVILTKDSDPDVHIPGENKLFVVNVENFGPNPIFNIVLDDIWPASTCINYVDWTGSGFTKDPISLIWTNPGILYPGDTATLYISGSIDNDPSCVNPDYENVINLTYIELGATYNDSVSYHFSVIDAPVANISLVKTVNVSSVSSGDEIIYTIDYKNMGNIDLNTYEIIDYWPMMIEFISAIPFPSNIVSLSTGSILKWMFNTPLASGQTGQIILKGIVN